MKIERKNLGLKYNGKTVKYFNYDCSEDGNTIIDLFVAVAKEAVSHEESITLITEFKADNDSYTEFKADNDSHTEEIQIHYNGYNLITIAVNHECKDTETDYLLTSKSTKSDIIRVVYKFREDIQSALAAARVLLDFEEVEV